MDGEIALQHIEEKLDAHIEQHNKDSKTLLVWAIGIVVSIMGTVTAGFITYGALQEKVSNIEKTQTEYVTRKEYEGLQTLLNEKFLNLNDKLDNIQRALNIR